MVYALLWLKLAHINDVSNIIYEVFLQRRKTDFSELLVLSSWTYVRSSQHKTLSLALLWTVTLSLVQLSKWTERKPTSAKKISFICYRKLVNALLWLKLAHIKDVSKIIYEVFLQRRKTDFSELVVLSSWTYVWTSQHKTLSISLLWTVTVC